MSYLQHISRHLASHLHDTEDDSEWLLRRMRCRQVCPSTRTFHACQSPRFHSQPAPCLVPHSAHLPRPAEDQSSINQSTLARLVRGLETKDSSLRSFQSPSSALAITPSLLVVLEPFRQLCECPDSAKTAACMPKSL